MAAKVVITGGGTAGHLYPGLALARQLIAGPEPLEVVFIGSERGLESRLVPEAGFVFHALAVRGLRRSMSLRNVLVAVAFLRGVASSSRLLSELVPAVVVGTGGYASLCTCVGAFLQKIPVVVHEQNRTPGLANRVAARFARKVCVSFKEMAPEFGAKGEFVGNPVRPEIATLKRAEIRGEAIAHFGLEGHRRTLLIFGGSQGAKHINEVALGCFDAWAERQDLQILHLTGASHEESIRLSLEQMSNARTRIIWRVAGYAARMDLVYAASDLAVCRAGASTVSELAAVGLPAVFVPYPYATSRHQQANAMSLARNGAARVIDDADLTSGILQEEANALFEDEKLAQMSVAMKAHAVPDAAERLARVVGGVVADRRPAKRG